MRVAFHNINSASLISCALFAGQSCGFVSILPIEAKWRLSASVIEPSLVQIIWTKADLMSIEFVEANFSAIWQYNHFLTRVLIWKYRLQHDVHFVAVFNALFPADVSYRKVSLAITDLWQVFDDKTTSSKQTGYSKKAIEHNLISRNGVVIL